MQCSNCRAISDSDAKFCSFCGNPLSKIQKEEEEFFRGFMKSNTKPQEIWNFDKGSIKCAEGNSKGAVYRWDNQSGTFSPENKENPSGFFKPSDNTLQFSFPTEKEPFYIYQYDPQSKSFKNIKGLARVSPVRYTSFVHWKLDGKPGDFHLKVEDGSDVKEGAPSQWDITGNIPFPVILFVSMYTQSAKIMADAIIRSKRVYKRCGKLVLTSAGPPKICKTCASLSNNSCICCERDTSAEKYQGQICKTCAPRKNFCVKCGDSVGNFVQEAFLCRNCGLGKSNENCCKMVFN